MISTPPLRAVSSGRRYGTYGRRQCLTTVTRSLLPLFTPKVHVCFSSCLFALKREAVFDDPDDTVSELVLDPNTTCSDFCHIPVS